MEAKKRRKNIHTCKYGEKQQNKTKYSEHVLSSLQRLSSCCSIAKLIIYSTRTIVSRYLLCVCICAYFVSYFLAIFIRNLLTLLLYYCIMHAHCKPPPGPKTSDRGRHGGKSAPSRSERAPAHMAVKSPYTLWTIKRWQYICNHNSGKSWWILIFFTYL